MPCRANAPVARHRVFYAVWPTDSVRSALSHCIQRLAGKTKARWVPPENLHTTLRFIGSVSATQLERMCSQSELDAEAFTLQLTRLRYRPRRELVWLEPSVVLPEWVALGASLRAALGSDCESNNERPSAPHVTLGRKVCVTAPLPRAVQTIVWPVESVVLVESTLRPSGAEYHVLRRWRLRATPAGGSMK